VKSAKVGLKTVLKKEDSITNCLCFLKKVWGKKKQRRFYKFVIICESVLQILFTFIFEYNQIWLNILLNDDHHLSNITKLGKKLKKNIGPHSWAGVESINTIVVILRLKVTYSEDFMLN